MQPVDAAATRYDTTTIVLHWLIAILVAVQWLGAQTIDFFPRGALRVDARSMHITFGLVLGTLLLVRIIWRATKGRRLEAADEGFLHVIAKATHYALYLLLISMVLVGIFLAWTRGDNIFNLFSIPAFDPGNKALPDQVQEVHATIGWIIVAVAGAHASAALIHRYLWKDGVLSRMLTRS